MQTSLQELASSVHALEHRMTQVMREELAANLPRLPTYRLQRGEQDHENVG